MIRLLLCLVVSASALPLSTVDSPAARVNSVDPIPPPPELPTLDPSLSQVINDENIAEFAFPEEPMPDEPKLEELAALEPIPEEPAHEEPTPEEPAPEKPALAEPAPTEPALAEPALAEPALAESTPAKPYPEEPPKIEAPITFSEPMLNYVEPIPLPPSIKETSNPMIIKLEVNKPSFLSWLPSFPSLPSFSSLPSFPKLPSFPSLPSFSSFQLPSWSNIPLLSSIFNRPSTSTAGLRGFEPLRAPYEVVDNYRYMPKFYYV